MGTLSTSELIFVCGTNTLSCPKKGTSYHLFTSSSELSVISNIPTILASSIVMVANFSAAAYVCAIDFTVPEKAFTFFVNVNSDGIPPVIWLITTSVGS